MSNFWHLEIIIEKALTLNFEMNTTEVSCDWANSTFLPFQQNAVKKLELFRNDSQIFIPIQSTARMALRYVIGFTRARTQVRSLPETHLSNIFFCTNFSSEFWLAVFKTTFSWKSAFTQAPGSILIRDTLVAYICFFLLELTLVLIFG